MSSVNAWTAALALVWAALTAGCVSHYPDLESVGAGTKAPPGVELQDVPFFPQDEFQCGPAALATVLVDSGVAVTPDELTDKVYLPEREGSLQLELIAASRRYERLPYVLDGTLAAILAELAAGRPVLVLQNLGVASFPIWHYAVVVGYDAPRSEIILRSGEEQRATMDTQWFMRSWSLAGNWALVTLEAGELPVEPDETRYVHAVVALESVVAPGVAAPFYATAVRRWPDDAMALLGLGNAYHAMGDDTAAEQTYQRLLTVHPDNAVARNNLAHVLVERGCKNAALHQLQLGLDKLDADDPLHQALLATREQIEERTGGVRLTDPIDCPSLESPQEKEK
ncbi:MAG: PA2778 family cysteine peptidase [Halieaceae bacterium]|nr:PA2778 family cysteine peptidase [Halieaceae bacterium]MCP5148508.1 PA2778 family cysteine peptidase [Pseudomonadales bacterium]